MTIPTKIEGDVPEYDELYEAFRYYLPILDELKFTPQDPKWHPEGDVETHTSWVIEELRSLNEKTGFEPKEKAILAYAALLHDIGKTQRTRKEVIDGEERLISYGHAILGRSIVGRRLSHVLSPEVWWKVLQLVGYHHKPAYLVEIDDEYERQTELIRLSRLISPRLLYHLEIPDIRGRGGSTKEGEEKLELFRLEYEQATHQLSKFDRWDLLIEEELSEEYSSQTIEFVQAEARYSSDQNQISTPEEAIARSYQYRDNHPTLTILCGPSGSGKSTWAEKQNKDEVISLDRIRDTLGDGPDDHSNEGQVRQDSKTRLKRHLADGKDVIWDATNYRRDFRDPLVSLGYQYGAFVRTVVLCAPQSTCEERSDVPERILNKQFDGWQFPESTEGHVVEYLDENHELMVRCLGGQVVEFANE